MDVRCEKCQTEYELDESRLKPGGVTVKCTNCGHMFKIRKRAITNVGAGSPVTDRARTSSSRPQPLHGQPRADSMLADEAPTKPLTQEEGPTTVERQWVLRLENGEQKACRELATLQQWIVGNIVTRETLISRTGKTWKRLGDIAELAQYFDIADEARRNRGDRATKQTGKPAAGTMLGIGGPAAAGGTILPDDDDVEGRTTGKHQARALARPPTQPPPVPGKVVTRTPPMGAPQAPAGSGPVRRPLTTPPPPPAKKSPSQGPLSNAQTVPATPQVPARSGPPDSRATAAWASDPVKTDMPQSGPFGGKISAIPDEPAFAAGRVRVGPSEDSSFRTDRVGAMPMDDDDDDLVPGGRGGSKVGLIILAMALVIGGATAAIVYLFVIKKDKSEQVVTAPADAAAPVLTPDAGPVVVTPVIDAPDVVPLTPLEVARGELAADNEARLRLAYDSLAAKEEPDALATRAQLGAAIAQALVDRAPLVERGEGDKLRKDSKTLTLEVATAAQKAHKVAPDDAGANLAMAHVMRLQAKPARDVKRYLDVARAKAVPQLAREIAIADALLLHRDGKLDDAKAAFAAIDQGEGKLETSNDVRARFHLALIAHAQKKRDEAKPLVEQILAAQPEHTGAKALLVRLETQVATDDPLPPEDPGTGSQKPTGSAGSAVRPPDAPLTGTYDSLLTRANDMAERNCTKALEIYLKALEQKPNGVEALTGMGYCHIDAKQFSSAFSKFRAALAVSPRFEPALWGVAEAYSQQGRKDEAIAAAKAYLEVYPGVAKATRLLERLGDGGSPTPPPTPTPTPPAPTPTPPAQGSGAGSG